MDYFYYVSFIAHYYLDHQRCKSDDFPHHHGLVVPHRIHKLILFVKQHPHNVARVASVCTVLPALQSRVPVQVNQAPVIPCRDDILPMAPVHSIHMVATLGRGEDALHPPSQFHRVARPLLILQHAASRLDLGAGIDVKEQVFIGTTVGVDIVAVAGPVDVGDK